MTSSEMTTRLMLTERILEWQRLLLGQDYYLTTESFSVLASLPAKHLTELEGWLFDNRGDNGTADSFDVYATQMQSLARIVLQSAASDMAGEAPLSDGRYTVPPRQDEMEKCLNRDQCRCIMTGTPDPHVCYIVPQTSNNTPDKTCKLYTALLPIRMLTLWREQDLLLRGPGSTDRAWNMLCLCPTLRDWWWRGYFALKCLDMAGATGVDDTVVHLQLHWLPRQTQPLAHPGIVPSQAQAQGEGGEACIRRWEQSPRHGTEPPVSNEAGNTTHGADDEIVAMMNSATGRLLRTGDVFTVTMPSPGDRVMMKAMLDVQWACLRFASMSGAAGEPRFVAEGDDHTMS